MLGDSITEDQLRIVIHHIGGIGGYGPSTVLDKLDHVQWIIYDAQEESLSSADKLPSGKSRLVNRCIGGTNARTQFNITCAPSASSVLMSASSAANYTVMLPDRSARIWGVHAQVTRSVDVQISTLDSLVNNKEVPPVDFLSLGAQGAELMILREISQMLKTRIAGVICDIEFANLYEEQALFCDIQELFRRDRFRLCEIYSPQYLNTAPPTSGATGKRFPHSW